MRRRRGTGRNDERGTRSEEVARAFSAQTVHATSAVLVPRSFRDSEDPRDLRAIVRQLCRVVALAPSEERADGAGGGGRGGDPVVPRLVRHVKAANQQVT